MLYNCHVHSIHSHDCDFDIRQMCSAAVNCGLSGIAITDHCDCEFAIRDHVWDRISSSFVQTSENANCYKNLLTVLCGIEIGDALFDPSFAEKITKSFSFDIVLLSVHAVENSRCDVPFSGIDFSEWTQSDLHTYLEQYFFQLERSVDQFDFDVLSHLTIPLRYIVYKYQRNISMTIFKEQIARILRRLISLDKAIELNTQSAEENIPFFLPDESVLDLYLEMGGDKIVLGSDAHSPDKIAAGLSAGKTLLLKKGIHKAYYYKNRQSIAYDLI